MSIIAGLIAAIPSIIQMVQGGQQKREARQIENQTAFPQATIAPSIEKATGYSFGRTLASDIPGGELYRNEIKGATAAGMRAASELGEGSEAYGMLGQLAGREQNQLGQMAKLTAQQVSGYQGDYLNALGAKAGEENRIWGWNEAEPYMRAANIAMALRNSGIKNQYAGLSNMAGVAADTVAGKDMMSALNEDNTSTFYREDKGQLDNWLRMILDKLKKQSGSVDTKNLSSPDLFTTPSILAPAPK
jgi:hypothetical protein